MHRLLSFFVSAGRWGITLMTGGLVAYSVAAYEHVSGHSLSAFVWVTLGAALFMVGAFFAWNEQFNKAMLAGNPEIVIEYDKPHGQIVPPSLVVRNLGGGNAYKLKIRDMTNGAAVVVFNEIQYLEERQACEATFIFNKFRPPSPFAPQNFSAFLGTAEDAKAVVDYSNVSDMRFTAEFKIRSATYPQGELHAIFVRRDFNPKRRAKVKS